VVSGGAPGTPRRRTMKIRWLDGGALDMPRQASPKNINKKETYGAHLVI